MKINNPIIKFPVKVSNDKEWERISKTLHYQGYKWLSGALLIDKHIKSNEIFNYPMQLVLLDDDLKLVGFSSY